MAMTDLTLFDARVARDEAMERVETNAGDEWRTEAWAWLHGYLETHGELFPDTDLRDGPEPRERRAWGVLVRRALKEGLIVGTGEFRARTRGHCTPGPVYRSLIYREAS
jgi:hypothetical protein